MPRLAAALAFAVLWPVAAWAQAENIAKGADAVAHAANNVADQGGILGSLAVIAIGVALLIITAQAWAIVKLYGANQDLQDKRAQDSKDATKDVVSTSIAGTSAITASNARLDDHSARIQTLAERLLPLSDAMKALTTAFDNYTRELQLQRGQSQGVK